MVDVNRRILELRPLSLRGGYHRCCIKVKEILHKLVGMLRFNSVGSEHVCWEIPLIEGHDHAGTAADGRSENMAIVGVGQSQPCNEIFIPIYQTIGDCAIHQV
ncbi:Uncharacterised protein [Bordetella bronchiseptica]|nr:Uncharacterised protein [Bordetella bronchiseptica]